MIRRRLLFLLAACSYACEDPVEPSSSVCVGITESTLAPVTFVFDRQSCEYSAADAAAGFSIGYSVHIESDVMAVMPRPPEFCRCEAPGPSGLVVHAELVSDDRSHRYYQCENGCAGGLAPQRTLVTGDYSNQVRLEARDYQGAGPPTGSGAPFPPGDYDVVLSSEGVIGTGTDAVGLAIIGRYQLSLH
jgi:hypothetical protein